MMKTTEGPHDRVPKFANEQDAAAFWDTHSPLDFPGDFEEVEIRREQSVRQRGLTIKLDQAMIDKLTDIAREQGLDPSTLARMWILEHLRSRPAATATGTVR
jgi:hypothetical protein